MTVDLPLYNPEGTAGEAVKKIKIVCQSAFMLLVATLSSESELNPAGAKFDHIARAQCMGLGRR